ncbi:AMP-binding protein [Streptomyces sp. NPDC026206]|uniref:AMP-binding protein n=1 Tax=Streptomyces sp. NPDC026206 TaxID=3157089 RepID=UPI0033F9F349
MTLPTREPEEGRVDTGAPARYAAELFAGLRRWGARTALRAGDRRVTFDQLLEESYRIARALDGTGLGRRDGVVALTANPPELVSLRLAAHLLGCRFTALNVTTPGDVVTCRQVLAEARPAVFVVDRRGAAALPEPVPGMLTLGAGPAGCDLLALAGTESGAAMEPRAREQDVALLVYSRGTTGRRRGAVHRFSGMNVTWRRPQEGELGDFAEGVTSLVAGPLADNAGEVALMLLRAGCTMMLMDDFDPARVLAAVESERIASVYLLSGQLERLVAHEDLTRTDVSSLRYLPYGNAPISPDSLRRAVDAFGPVLSQNYVSSEIRAITLLRQEDHLAAADGRPELLASVGQGLPDVGIRICGPDGRGLRAGEVGEVRIRAPHMMSGYWRDAGATSRAVCRGWLRSGDLGRLDREGYLYLCGRAPG